MDITFDFKEFITKTKLSLVNPKRLFENVQKEKDWKVALSYSIAISLLQAVIGVVQTVLLYPAMKNILPEEIRNMPTPQFAELLPTLFVSAVLVILLSFVWSFALKVWLNVWRVKENYWGAYKIYVYSRAPITLLGWIPWIGAFSGLYSVYVMATGISTFSKVSIKKSIIILLPLIIGMLILQYLSFALITQGV